MHTSKRVVRLKLWSITTSATLADCNDVYCPFCGRSVIDSAFSDLDVHHQGKKTMTISRACAYSLNRALKEYYSGDCVWVHRTCHIEYHKTNGVAH